MLQARALAVLLLALIILSPTGAADVAGFQARNDRCGALGDLGLWSCMASHVGVASLECGEATCLLEISVNSLGEGSDTRLRDRLHVFIDENLFTGDPATTEVCTAAALAGAIGCDGAASFTIDIASQECRSFTLTTRFTEAALGFGNGDDSLMRTQAQTGVVVCTLGGQPELSVRAIE